MGTTTEARATELLAHLASGRALTHADLAALSGLSEDQAQRALSLARRAGLVRPAEGGGGLALTTTGQAAARLLATRRGAWGGQM